MSTIEEAREQARKALTTISKRMAGSRLGKSTMREMDADILALRAAYTALRALLDATEPPEAQEAAEPMRDADGDMISSGEHRKISMSGDSFFVCDTCTNVLGLNVRWDHASKREDHQAAVESLLGKPAEDERETLDGAISRLSEYVNAGSIIHVASSYRTGDGKVHLIEFDDLREVLNAAAGYSKGPRPITDEMVAAADFAIMPYWGERYPSGSLTTEIARAALEAAEAARR